MAESADEGNQLRSRGFDLGATSFAVASDEDVAADVEAMFADLPASTQPIHHFQIVSDETGVHLVTPSQELSVTSAGQALALLATSVNRLALDEDPERLHLHCAAASNGGVGALVSAPSGTGKSTLVAALARSGWTYLTDEAVALDGTGVRAFNKPILLKAGATELLGLDSDIGVALPESPVERAVPASALGAPLATTMTPNVVVIMARNLDGTVADTPRLEPLHPTDAAVSLVEQSMDPERFGPSTLETLLGLTTSCACFRLTPGTPADTVEVLAEIDPTPTPLVAVAISPAPVVADAVVSYLVGDRVAVHATDGGAVAALDEAGSAAWLALHGRAPDWYPAELLQDGRTRPFLDKLVSLDLIRSADVADVTS